MDYNKFQLPLKYRGQEKNIWYEYNQLAAEWNPVNLGQGFPDFNAPDDLLDALVKVCKDDDPLLHQYSRGFGHPALVKQLSILYSKLIGREINEYNEIIVTFGAYEALYCAISGNVNEGDEVIIIEPFFDCYNTMARTSGGVARYIPLRPKYEGADNSADWYLDKDELEALFNEKTKMIILNTPHNPLGKIFKLDELQVIADLCKKFDVLCIADEVYEWLVFDSNKHIRIATLPGMWERTITIGSAGKTFSVTGWHLGWAYGPANLIRNLQVVHNLSVYTGCTPIQEAVAQVLRKENGRMDSDQSYFRCVAQHAQRKRDFTVKFLTDAGIKAIVPEGGYFVTADWSTLDSSINLDSETDKYMDWRFTKWMTKNIGVLGIPISVFYNEEHKYLAEKYTRFCFIKKDENLQKAADLIQKWRSKRNQS